MNMTKPVIVLTVICIVCSALLGATYTATAPLIAASDNLRHWSRQKGADV